MITLGEFRKRTQDLPDDVVLLQCVGGEYVGIVEHLNLTVVRPTQRSVLVTDTGISQDLDGETVFTFPVTIDRKGEKVTITEGNLQFVRAI